MEFLRPKRRPERGPEVLASGDTIRSSVRSLNPAGVTRTDFIAGHRIAFWRLRELSGEMLRATRCGWPLTVWMSGGVLLSHDLPVAVPSALSGLTSRFGMETGCFPDAMVTVTLWKYQPTTCAVTPSPLWGPWVLGG